MIYDTHKKYLTVFNSILNDLEQDCTCQEHVVLEEVKV